MDNRFLIEKNPLNQNINTFSIAIVNLSGLRNFHECTQNFLSPCMITMRNEINAWKSCLNMFLGKILILHTFQTICNNFRDFIFLTLMTRFWPLITRKMKVISFNMTIVVWVNQTLNCFHIYQHMSLWRHI